jgi:hypothetical protein
MLRAEVGKCEVEMIRKFKFEDEVHHSLACVPMAVRRKLDRIGVKVSLEQWQALAQHERLAICHLPTDSDEERAAIQTFLEETVRARAGSPTKALSDEVKRSAEPPPHPPERLVENAKTAGVVLNQPTWERLDGDERYALIKLGGGNEQSHNFVTALRELLD